MHLRAVLRQSQEGACSFSSEVAESINRRGRERSPVTLSAHTSSPTAGELPVLIRDISQGGLLIEAEMVELSIDEHIDVELPGRGLVRATVVWMSGPFFGCQFSQPIAPAAISAALLKGDRKVAPATALAPDRVLRSRPSLGVEPELNFSVAFAAAIALWALIGLALYMVLS
jgi:hypothetical protein